MPYPRTEETAPNSRETSVEERISSYLSQIEGDGNRVIPSLYLDNNEYYRFECCSLLKVMIRMFTVANKNVNYCLFELFDKNRMYYDFHRLLKSLCKERLSFFEQTSTAFAHSRYSKGQELLSLVSLIRLLIDPKEAGQDIIADLNALYSLLCQLYVKDWEFNSMDGTFSPKSLFSSSSNTDEALSGKTRLFHTFKS